MKNKWFVIIPLSSIIIIAAFFIVQYFALFQDTPAALEPVILNKEEYAKTNTPPTEVEYTVETFSEKLFVPWSIVFTSDNRMLVTERNGKIRIIDKGTLQTEPLATFSEISTTGEEGLMGMTLDPQYEDNKYIYVCLAYPKNGGLVDKVLRVTDQGNTINDTKVLLDDIPAAQYHAGCELGFSPDGKLYITTGDATDRQLAQDTNSLAGKILRINADGSIPEDNPFSNSAVWSYGHRNPQGLDWHPITNELYATEHGPSGFDGPAGGDEINRITKQDNHGWPAVSHTNNTPEFVAPLIVFTPAVAPGSATFYSGKTFPQFKNHFFFAALKGEGIYRVVFSENDPNSVVFYDRLQDIDVGRVREIIEGPDGNIYFTTSNRDGRGSERAGDDKIYRLVPKSN